MKTRTETDSLGPVEVPEDRYWGAQTQRSRENFPIGDETMPRALISAYGRVKAAAAEANARQGQLSRDTADLIIRAAREVTDHVLDAHFPLVVWQTGSGTQTNMNLNEVIANRAIELAGGELGSKTPVHPNDHVNRSQSSNDSFPTAMHVALSLAHQTMLPQVIALRDGLSAKAEAYEDVVKVGRTHLQDATPVTLGQELGGYVAQLDLARQELRRTADGLLALAIGGTAVGTGLNTEAGFGERVASLLAEDTGLPFRVADNRFAALASHEAIVAHHGALKTLACALMKIANDLRWLASGPRCGIGELALPANEPGSSIMPGKVNPTQCEALTMVCARVLGNDVTVGLAGASGNFELNVFKPVIIHAALQSTRLLGDACASFEVRCVRGMHPRRERIAELLDQTLMLVTALTPHIGYDAAAKIAKRAHVEGTTLREAAMEVVSPDDFDRWVRPEAMTRPASR